MALFTGKKGLILGVANDRSIAWAIAQKIMNEGGECGFTHLPDRPDDDKKKNRRRVEKCLGENNPQAKFLVPLNVQDDEQIAQVIGRAKEEFGQIDFLLHSIAFADRADLQKDTIETSREGFKMAMEISAYSLLAVANAAKDIMKEEVRNEKNQVVEPGSSILAMTYFGGERCVPGYNVMGICKAALDAATRYASFDLGMRGIRVNALSAGPLKTLASSAVGANDMLPLYEKMSPMGRGISHEEVANSGAYLLSDMSGGVTGEIHHVDAGYNMMGSPGRMLDELK